ncbi:MAG: hypothetical protein H7343_05950 [Undibacterium sp.]|nr:hypothetical protein [Opitutaceae bacterium]
MRLWRSSGQAAEHTTRGLGVSVFNLYEWGKRAGRADRAAGPHVSKEALADENERLTRELARITEPRDILKKPRASSRNRRRAVCPDQSDERPTRDQRAGRDTAESPAAAVTSGARRQGVRVRAVATRSCTR